MNTLKPIIFSLHCKDTFPDSKDEYTLISHSQYEPASHQFLARMGQVRLLTSSVVETLLIEDFQEWLISPSFDLFQAARYLRSFSPFVTRQKRVIQGWCLLSESIRSGGDLNRVCVQQMILMTEYELFMIARLLVRLLSPLEIYTLCHNEKEYTLGEPIQYDMKYYELFSEPIDDTVYSWDDNDLIDDPLPELLTLDPDFSSDQEDIISYCSPPVVIPDIVKMHNRILSSLCTPVVFFSCGVLDTPLRLLHEDITLLIVSGTSVPVCDLDFIPPEITDCTVMYTESPIGEIPHVDSEIAHINFSSIYTSENALSWASIDGQANQNYTLWDVECPWIPGEFSGPYLYRDIKVYLRYSVTDNVVEKMGSIYIHPGISAVVSPFSNWFSHGDYIVFDNCVPPSEISVLDVSTSCIVDVETSSSIQLATTVHVCVRCIDPHTRGNFIIDYMSRYGVDYASCKFCGSLHMKKWTPRYLEAYHFSPGDNRRIYSYDSRDYSRVRDNLYLARQDDELRRTSTINSKCKWRKKQPSVLPYPSKEEVMIQLDYERLSNIWHPVPYEGRLDGGISYRTLDEDLFDRFISVINNLWDTDVVCSDDLD